MVVLDPIPGDLGYNVMLRSKELCWDRWGSGTSQLRYVAGAAADRPCDT